MRDRVLSLETDLCPRRRSGEWGKESSKVQEKRGMLVKEGVRYVPPVVCFHWSESTQRTDREEGVLVGCLREEGRERQETPTYK